MNFLTEVGSGNSEEMLIGSESFDIRSQSDGLQMHPLLALEERYLKAMLPEVHGRKIRKKEMGHLESNQENEIVVRGGRCAIGPRESIRASIHLGNGCVTRILSDASLSSAVASGCPEIDLSGFLILPGLINAHDHLHLALFPRLADPPYQNYIDWGEDIHSKFPDVIAKHRAVPKDVRLWWGGIRNLLCGVTTVSHHDPLWPDLRREDFPVRVVQEFGWGHSVALGGDLRAAHSATAEGGPFIVHACEGVDEIARNDLQELDRLGVLDDRTVIVHGLAINREGIALMRQRGAKLVICPSSNQFLFGRIPDMSILGDIEFVALGNDSPLTAQGDLLDEIRFAAQYCSIPSDLIYRMVTETPATVLRLDKAEGSIRPSGIGDLIAVRDTNRSAADTLQTLSMIDVEFVMIGGRIHLASESIFEKLPVPLQRGLEPLWIDGTIRWLRAPVKELLRKAEEVLGTGEVRLGGKPVRIPA